MNSRAHVYIKTFGCRTNLFDSQVMSTQLGSDHYAITANEQEADVVIINSCTVTNSADSSVRHYINRLHRERPEVKILFTGCGVATQGKQLLNEGKVTGVFGHSEKEEAARFLTEKPGFFVPGDLHHVDSTVVTEFVGKSRAFLKIQEGCDFACSYCIIPTVRGRARSLKETTILEQVRVLLEQGFTEFVLTGTNVGSYGKDTGTSLAELLPKIGALPGVKRIRLGSIEPIQVTDALLEVMQSEWMARHLHIALQHTDDVMLERMNRRNRFTSDQKLFEKLSNKGFALGTDYIVGFPGETEALFENGLERVKMLPLTHIHAFTYSIREGTPAASMKETVPGDVAKERHRRLTDAVQKQNFHFRHSHRTGPLEILIEGGENGLYHGLDQFFNRIQVVSGKECRGEWVRVTDYDVKESGTIGRLRNV